MATEQPREPNPHHKPETSSNAITQIFECEMLGPDSPEIQERERQRLERLKNEERKNSDESQERN